MSKIVNAQADEITLTNDDPGWRYALGAASSYRGFLLRLESDQGTVGWGYGKDYHPRDVTFAYVRGAFDAGVKMIVGEDCDQFGTLAGRLESVHEIATCQVVVQAFEMAVLDIVSQEHALPLAGLLGGVRRSRIPILRILSLKEPREVAGGAQQLVADGIRYLKIKLENRPLADDVSRVFAVRDAVGPDVHLSVDANQTYDAKSAIRFCRLVEDAGIELFEQPVPASDYRALKFVKDEVGCLVEAHEAARSLLSLRTLIELDAIDSVNIGIEAFGLRGMFEAASLCDAFGVKVRLGVHLGPRVFVASAAHIAAALPTLSFASELGEFERLANDPSDPLEIIDGELVLPTVGGIGLSGKSASVASVAK
jgi:L-alanine-DL-glutamate epimerase-like enolase superfamily enzyme